MNKYVVVWTSGGDDITASEIFTSYEEALAYAEGEEIGDYKAVIIRAEGLLFPATLVVEDHS